MGDKNPLALLDLIDRERLDDLDKVVYDGTKRFVELCDASLLNAATSNNYQVKYAGQLGGRVGFFSFMGQEGIVMADYLRKLPHDDLLVVAEDEEFMRILREARNKPIYVSIPTTWSSARQMNHGLYEEAALFGIKPPCVRIGTKCEPEVFGQKVELLAEIHNQLEALRIKRVRGSEA